MNDELVCPDCGNIIGNIGDVRDDGRIYCYCCDSMFYVWEIDSPFKNEAEWLCNDASDGGES